MSFEKFVLFQARRHPTQRGEPLSSRLTGSSYSAGEIHPATSEPPNGRVNECGNSASVRHGTAPARQWARQQSLRKQKSMVIRDGTLIRRLYIESLQNFGFASGINKLRGFTLHIDVSSAAPYRRVALTVDFARSLDRCCSLALRSPRLCWRDRSEFVIAKPKLSESTTIR